MTTRTTRMATTALAAAALATAGGLLGLGTLSVASASTAHAAAGTCAGTGKAHANPYRLTMRNNLSQAVTWTFSGVDCADWVGRSPMMPAYTPLALAPGQSSVLVLDPNCRNNPKVFTATLSSGRTHRTVRLGVRNGNCKSDPTALTMWAQNPSLPPSSAPWVAGAAATVPTGGRSWQITATVGGGEGRGTVAVGLLP